MENINKNVVVEFIEYFYDTNFNNQDEKNYPVENEGDSQEDNNEIKREVELLEIKDSNDLLDDIEVTTNSDIDSTSGLEMQKNIYEIIDITNIQYDDNQEEENYNEDSENMCFCENLYYIIDRLFPKNIK